MSAIEGFNPMRWQCSDRGCYNVKHRPKIEIFAASLPGKIAMTDIDATTEVNGHFLFLEFKSGEPRPLPTGQRIYFQRLTLLSDRIWIVIVCGDAETMVITHIMKFWRGISSSWQPSSLQDLMERIERWASRAKATAFPIRRAA